MFGIGTLLNTGAVIVGGIIGMMLKKGLSKRFEEILMVACGVSTLFIGAGGTMQGMLHIEHDVISTQGGMLLVLSFVIGGLIGEAINLEKKMDEIGETLKRLFHAENDNLFVDGFVNTSLIICVGAMAIVGSIQDGLVGDYSTLAVKAVLDLVIVIVMAASYGPGSICSAIAIFVYQGSITLVAHFAGNFVADALIADLSYIGSALIFCVGVNLAFGKKFKTGNLLPALLVPIAYSIIQSFL